MSSSAANNTHRKHTGSLREQAVDPYKFGSIFLGALFIATLPALLALIVLTEPAPPAPRWAQAAATLGVSADDIAVGELIYQQSCALCHGPEGDGMARLGKPIRNSAFVRESTDAELVALITEGRTARDPANTTGVLMPARGARGLDDRTIGQIVGYVRAIQDPAAPVASVEAWNLFPGGQGGAAPEGTEVALGGVGYDLFAASCSACHGVSGQGMDGLGKPLTNSEFVDAKSDKELMAFIKTGRPIWDAENTTGLDMPPKGGNPALNDQQIEDIIKFIRSMHD